MSNLSAIQKELSNGKNVYLFDDFEQAVFRLVPTKDKTIAFAKFKGKKEYQLDQSTQLVYDAEMGGEIVSKEFYDKF